MGLHILANEVLAPIAIVVWLVLARMITLRRDAARISVAAFFGLITLTMLASLSASGPAYAMADFTAGMVLWLISTVSMVLVFTPASNRYFRPEPELVGPAG